MCCLLSVLAISLHAQHPMRRSPEEKAKLFTAEMNAEIKLTPEQETGIYQINLRVSRQFDSLYTIKPEKTLLHKATVELLKARDADFRKILSNEQFLRFDDWQREKREKKIQDKKSTESPMNQHPSSGQEPKK